ncbi:hypothetical protein [Candidatus Albibeggiatoa sp. nov. NOAA]|uniref:hypothetical protein n=1 Tax=Candidatus Albibeggiatoa sp. nov. NOAA TaxID=3162724 RepID=UPI0032F520BF|nr:hypothetical protein [Thiotrichaceae bacterium]
MRMLAFCSILLFSSVTIADVDLTKAYIIPDGTTNPSELVIGGVETRNGDNVLVEDFLLNFSINPDDNAQQVNLIGTRQAVDVDLLQQRLRGTKWVGEYDSGQTVYLSRFTFKTIQNGFVVGEMEHKTAEPEPSKKLVVQVLGEIKTQFLVDLDIDDPDNELTWVDSTEVGDDTFYPESYVRHLIRLRRGNSIETIHPGRGWGRFNVYDLALENGELRGSIYVPAENYRSPDTFGNGVMTLREEVPLPEVRDDNVFE